MKWPPQRIPLRRHWINAFKERHFIALSYTWEASEDEDKTRQRYRIQARDKKGYFPSGVRDCVFERIFKFMHVHDVPYLWIDRHCVAQQSCKKPCKHKRCVTKRNAIHAMDLVYQRSLYPVALLGRPITSTRDISMLARILSGELASRYASGIRSLKKPSLNEARQALALLDLITSDYWWTRAWTFQENYRAGPNMTLLIPHTPCLERTKRKYGKLFGRVPGELNVRSTHFSKQATRLCQAAYTLGLEKDTADRILRMAGRYTFLLEDSDLMTSRIVADIRARDLREISDLPGIIANCCQYQRRLRKDFLDEYDDIDLAIFALRLLNGEVLNNGRGRGRDLAEHTVDHLFFRQFRAPRNLLSLTYNKSCRFHAVALTKMGVVTTGHLWKLGRVIHIGRHFRHMPYLNSPGDKLQMREYLVQLVKTLSEIGAQSLAEELKYFLRYDHPCSSLHSSTPSTFAKHHKSAMLKEVITAIQEGKSLRLAHLQSHSMGKFPASALFVHKVNEKAQRRSPPGFVFTASRPKLQVDKQRNHNDLHRYVSFEVDVAGLTSQLPQLHIKQWMPGLCFFSGCPRREVLFPWPDSLMSSLP